MVSWCFLRSRGAKTQLFIQNQLLSLFRLLRPKVTFCEKVTFELPGLEKVAIFHWFLKGPERSAPSATFDDTKTVFAEKSVKFSWNFRKFREFHFSKVQKRVPTFARLRMTVATRSRSVTTRPLFAKVRKVRNFHFFYFWSENERKNNFFRFWSSKSDFSRPGSPVSL